MLRRLTALFVVLVCTSGFTTPVRQDSSPAANATGINSDATGLNRDLERMNSLLMQMQKNAAFVSRGDTPLKHQFELEIEMWQILIQDMQRKVNGGDSR
jgi:ABC-type tungstate transport system permease subunit